MNALVVAVRGHGDESIDRGLDEAWVGVRAACRRRAPFTFADESRQSIEIFRAKARFACKRLKRTQDFLRVEVGLNGFCAARVPQLFAEEPLEFQHTLCRFNIAELLVQHFVAVVVLAEGLSTSKWKRFAESATKEGNFQ